MKRLSSLLPLLLVVATSTLSLVEEAQAFAWFALPALQRRHQPALFLLHETTKESFTVTTTTRRHTTTTLYTTASSTKKNDDQGDTASSSSSKNEAQKNQNISANQVYFDIAVAGNDIGRLVFDLRNPSPLPLHAENLIQLVKGSRRSIDPLAHYVGCQFDYSPATIEDGMGRYRWGHSCKGRGRNAIGPADQPLKDAVNQLQCTHSCYGGQYYGIDVYTNNDNESRDDKDDDQDPKVYLTVSVAGPNYGRSKFSVVRVGESPQEWRERLLLNAGVIGKLQHNDDLSSLNVLHQMARQRVGPPTIVASGVL
jgi:hypothetical protein